MNLAQEAVTNDQAEQTGEISTQDVYNLYNNEETTERAVRPLNEGFMDDADYIAENEQAEQPAVSANTDIAEQRQASIEELSANLGETGQEAYVNMYGEGGPESVIEYNEGFTKLYNAARNADPQAVSEARMDPAVQKLSYEQQSVAVSAGTEDAKIDLRESINGRQGENLSGEGREWNISQRTGEPVTAVSRGAGEIEEGWEGWNSAADREIKAVSGRLAEAEPAESLIRTAEPGQVYYPIQKDATPTVSQAVDMANKYGINNVKPFVSKTDIAVTGGEAARAFSDPASRTVGFRANDEGANGKQLVGHELVEFGVMDGKVSIPDAIESLNGVVSEDDLNSIISIYIPEGAFDRPDITAEEVDRIIANASKEMVCDVSNGINQLRGYEGLEQLSNVIDDAATILNQYVNEKLGGALDGVLDEAAGSENGLEFSTKIKGANNGQKNYSREIQSKVHDTGRGAGEVHRRGELADRTRYGGRSQSRRGGETVRNTDSEGKQLTEEKRKALAGTAIINNDHEAIALYHGTGTIFDGFKYGDVGFHLGTLEQAFKRIEDKKIDDPVVMRMYANIKNPAIVKYDPHNWQSNAAALVLKTEGIISEKEYNEIRDLSLIDDRNYDSKSAKLFRQIMAEKGYDGIAYPNDVEGEGFSYIAFYDDQIIKDNVYSGEDALALREKLNPEVRQQNKDLNDASIVVDREAGVAHYEYSTKVSWKTPEQVNKAVKALQDSLGVDEKTARKYVKSEQSLTNLILSPGNVAAMDFEADDRYSAIKKNSDYPQGTVDFNNNCRKRVPFTTLYERLQRRNPNRVFTAEDLEIIRQEMIQQGYPVACAFCYVEERRQRLGEIAEGFVTAYNNGTLLDGFKGKKEYDKLKAALDKSKEDGYAPTIADLLTYGGLKALDEQHEGIAEAFRIYNNARGMQSGRLVEGRAEYKRELLSYTPKMVKRINDLGGLRIFSYSDFEAINLLDLVQIIQDASAVGIKIQAYTKVPAFAKVVRKTGIKLNRSLIPAGIGIKIVNGKPELDLDTVEGIDVGISEILL